MLVASSAPGGKREPIIHSAGQILLASDVSLGGLNRGMSQQKVDLLQFATGDMAQPRAGPPKVVGCQCRDSSPGRTSLDDVPDDILGDAVPPYRPVLSD